MILYLGNKLVKHGFTPTSVETLGVRLEKHFLVVRHSSIRNPVLRLCHMMSLVIRFRQINNILLVDTYSTWGFWYAVITCQLARLFKLSYIPILRGGNLPERFKTSPLFSKILLKHAKEVICPSEYLLNYVDNFYKRSYKLIPNFIDIKNYPFKEREVGSSIRLLWVRSFHEIYNPQLAVDIVYDLKQKSLDVKLCMVGPDKDGSMKETIAYAEMKGVLNQIDFTGRMSKSDWISLSKDYDVFINTTNVDNTPVSVMEAMALGMIVISTNVGGMPYLFLDKSEGILVRPNDSRAFVNQILKLRDNEVYSRNVSRNARKKAEQWDWINVERLWINCLTSI